MNDPFTWMATTKGSILMAIGLLIAIWGWFGLRLLKHEQYSIDRLDQVWESDFLTCFGFILLCAFAWPWQGEIVDYYVAKYCDDRKVSDE